MRLPSLPFLRSRPLRLVWRVEKAGAVHYLAGTAHFFPYSYARALTSLLKKVELAIFEGPLDETSMAHIAAYGQQGDGGPSLAERMAPETIAAINARLAAQLANNEEGGFMFLPHTRPDYFAQLADGARPWMAFFSIWTAYLGWPYSVDMEAFRIARRLGKPIFHLETLEEQLAVLDGIPIERLLAQLNDVNCWDLYRDQFEQYFLSGELEKLVSMSGRFPTRVPTTISARDRLMVERLLPLMENNSTATFVGMPHIPGVRAQLEAAGFIVTQEAQ